LEATLTRPISAAGGDFSFGAKLAAAVLLVAAADWLFFFQRIGSSAGLYAAALLVLLVLTQPQLRRGSARAATAAAAIAAAALSDSPSWLAAGLFWIAASLAVLLPKGHFDDGWRWARRLFVHAFCMPVGLVQDAARIRSARRRWGGVRIADGLRHVWLQHLWLPALGSVVFLALFAAANPLIEDAFSAVDLAAPLAGLSMTRICFWVIATLLVWSLVRSRLPGIAPAMSGEAAALPGLGTASVTLSLAAFNLVFALQNGLDLCGPVPGCRTICPLRNMPIAAPIR
jgi:hypothetical protein